jgi:xanthine dehydrogenase accessory factor
MLLCIIRGGGDLASGIAVRLFRSGIKVVITELEKPLAVRRYVSYAQAVYSNNIEIENIRGKLIEDIRVVDRSMLDDSIPILIDPDLTEAIQLNPAIVVDARMLKQQFTQDMSVRYQIIGIGPGFEVGINCHCVIETKRGGYLGRVFWEGSAETDSGIPEKVGLYEVERVLRATSNGIFNASLKIGDLVEKGEVIANINGMNVNAPFKGIIRGLLHDGLQVKLGMKIGDIDPRCDPFLCTLVSDKALAIGGGVLEAILSWPQHRRLLGN